MIKLFIESFSLDNIRIQLIILTILNLSHILLQFLLVPKNVPDFKLEKPNLTNYKKGNLLLGTIFRDSKPYKPFNMNIEDLQRHILIYGQTGTGKTTFLKNLLCQYVKKYPTIPFLLFEFKGEYSKLENLISDVKIIKPGSNFFFNLFDHDIFSPDIYSEKLFDSFKTCQIIEGNADFSPQMEKIFVDALERVCNNPEFQSWEGLLNQLDEIQRENLHLKTQIQIPQLNQTIISLKNRLRRYYAGPLKTLFNFDPDANQLSELLRQNVIIDLGNILKIGGMKEDVIFFSNLVLKLIWEKNMNLSPTNQLRHLTIFEDASYIASKKLLEASRLTTYLEDIAKLLRGKGEALITLTTTLDISKNIILNSGTKFFFKFNEKLDDVGHYISNSSKDFEIQKLPIGICLTKIDSIPDIFLLKSIRQKENQINESLREKKGRKRNNKIKKKGKRDPVKNVPNLKVEPIENNQLNKNFHENLVENAVNVIIDPLNYQNDLKRTLKKAEELFLIDNFNNSFLYIKKFIKNMIKFTKQTNGLNLKEYQSQILFEKFEISEIIIKKAEINENQGNLSSEEIIHLLNLCKDIFNELPSVNEKSSVELLKSTIKNGKVQFRDGNMNIINDGNIGEDFSLINLWINFQNQENEILNFFELGSRKIEDDIRIEIQNLMEDKNVFMVGEYSKISISSFSFEIISKWSSTKQDNLQLVMVFNKSLKDFQFLRQVIQNEIHIFTKEIRIKSDIYKAFYLMDTQKRIHFKDEIITVSLWFKKRIKSLFNRVNEQISFFNAMNEEDAIKISLLISDLMKLEQNIEKLSLGEASLKI